MTAIGITTIVCITVLFVVRMWVDSRAYGDMCGCGHPAAFHKESGGCRHNGLKSTDCYGYCTCERSFHEVAARAVA